MSRITFTKDQVKRVEKLLSEWKDADIDDVIFLIRRIHGSSDFWAEVEKFGGKIKELV